MGVVEEGVDGSVGFGLAVELEAVVLLGLLLVEEELDVEDEEVVGGSVGGSVEV